LGVGMRVDWIVFTRHARRLDCDASIGTIVKADDGGPRRGPRLTKPYVSSGYVLVLPAASPTITRLEDVKGKIAVEHTSWPHYVLDMRKVPVASYGSSFEVLDALAKGEEVAGLVSDTYVGWYLKLHPGSVKISQAYVPARDFRWNVAGGLRNADPPLVDAVNRAIEVIIGPVFPAPPPCWTPLVESGVPAGVVTDGPVVTPPAGAPPGPEPMGPVAPPGPTPPACGDAAPPACGEALGLETAPCAARLQ